MCSEVSMHVYHICLAGSYGLLCLPDKELFQEVIHVVSDLSFSVLRQIATLICFSIILKHPQLLKKALGCTFDRGQFSMNMLNMVRVFLHTFKF